MSKIGINGFGRIGRLVLRRLLETQDSNTVVAINDLTSPKVWPTCSGMIPTTVASPSVDFTEDALIVDGKTIAVYAEKRQSTFRGKPRAWISSWSAPAFIPQKKNRGRTGRRCEESADFGARGRDEDHRL